MVEGVIDDLNTLEQVAMVAKIYDENFVNLMSVRGDHQVQLEVVFAEVSRTGLREMGLNIDVGIPGGVVSMLGPATSNSISIENGVNAAETQESLHHRKPASN